MVREVKEKVLQEIEEDEERKKRQKNLVIYNLAESKSKDGHERMKEDESACLSLFRDEVRKEAEIEQVIRLGKREERQGPQGEREGRPRPLLVKLTDAKKKWDILKHAKNLKHTTQDRYRKVIIAPDLTRKQQEKDRELRAELKRLREAGEEGWYISRGELKRNF